MAMNLLPDPSRTIKDRVLGLRLEAQEIQRLAGRVRELTLSRSPGIKEPNFATISEADLGKLFDYYDVFFFSSGLRELLRGTKARSLTFRLSSRMTRAGGKTFRTSRKVRSPQGVQEQVDYQIAISTFLLFQNFQDSHRTITVGGLECKDRLDALQRIFEHEITHLIEFLIFGESNCSAKPFRELARGVFGHTESHHDMVTSHERARIQYAIKVGDAVDFEFEGESLRGLVNRITRRATVLVESPKGRPYRDGKRYLTYYVPLNMLKPSART